jgi:hypothetical protein
MPGFRNTVRTSEIFYELDVEDGETLARRVGDAWLVISGGESRQHRLALLEHLHVTVNLK